MALSKKEVGRCFNLTHEAGNLEAITDFMFTIYEQKIYNVDCFICVSFPIYYNIE